ncbi:MAG: hypothetical protein LBH99_02815 [Rickettsia sp.]|jgi:hypothetical protein|nr:hypothetical protein [Rickettsia sp.]
MSYLKIITYLKQLKMKLKNLKKSEILASHSIVKDVELIKLIAEDLVYNKNS